MKFHREGRPTILLAVILALLIVISAKLLFASKVALTLAICAGAFVMVAVLQFFRNPERKMIKLKDAVIAPCDGKVVVIENVVDEEYFHAEVRQISIFMSPLNVHINWVPVGGEVVYSKYHPGKYLVAWDPKSSAENERHSVVIRSEAFGDVLVKQIAGAVARRIVNYMQVGQQVSQGSELGFIKFGSRVDLLVPKNANIEVKLNQVSVGGQTIIALR